MSNKRRIPMALLLLTLAGNASAHRTVSMAEVYADALFYRPAGLAATAAGGALFVALTPILAIANLAPPHDAFGDARGALIDTPYKFTFQRPLGVLEPDADGIYRRD